MKAARLSVLLTAVLLWVPILEAAQKMAVVTKARGDLSVKSTGDKKFGDGIKAGTVLSDGDVIRTGSDGFVVLVFLDDKSQIKLFENCTLEIKGEKSGGGLSKDMTMGFGKLKADVNKQVGTDFRIATPTSVASVKGTGFWMLSDESTGDQIIGLSGLVELLNQVSGQTVTVGSNQTGSSTLDGSTEVTVTTPESIPDDEGEEDGSEPNQLRFEYQDAGGNVREVIIDYR